MADDSEERPSIAHDFPTTKAAIFETVNNFKKWREEQVQQFRNLQYFDGKNIAELSGESQKQFEKLFENASKMSEAEERPRNYIPEISNSSCLSLKNDLENYNTLHESSITGHLQRCFNDSSASSIALSDNKVTSAAKEATVFNEAQNCQLFDKNATEKRDQQVNNVKPKRPFLKKGSGLLRYMPKSSPSGQKESKKSACVSNTPPKRRACLPQKTLELKPAIRKTVIPSENVKHIRFDIPVTSNEDVGYFSVNNVPKFSKLIEKEVNDRTKDKYSSLFSISPDHSPQRSSKSEDASNSESESLNLSKENKELEEFEMLENCVQNSSFNSDSSVVQRILHGETTKPFPVTRKEILKPPLISNVNSVFKETYIPGGNSIFSAKVCLSKCLEEVHARKESLQKVISDINPRIQSLQRETYRSTQETLDDSDISERCSTPVEDLNMRDRITHSLPENCSDVDSSDFYGSPPTAFHGKMVNDEEVCQTNCRSCVNDRVEDLYPDDDDDNLDEESTVIEESDVVDESKQVSNDRSQIRNKLEELEKEIEIYQKLNAELTTSCKERNEMLKKLQKEHEQFNKYKEAEKKKLEAEMEEERRQIKRQKETFNRLKKMRKDNPTRKEREEMNSLRQEVEKLQEELKRQKIKYTSDSRRWKNQLEVAERDRDNFILENIRLKGECEDLVAALKTRMKKRSETRTNDKTDNDTGHENFIKEFPTVKDAECQTEITFCSSDHSETSKQASPKNIAANKAKSKVRFNLSPEYQENELKDLCEDVENRLENQSKEDLQPTENAVAVSLNGNTEKDMEANLSTISVSAEYDFKEIDHGNMTEKIYATGEREVLFQSGTRKIVSADGKTRFLFPNGDIKEIFPDKRKIYRYVNGIIETHFPDGLQVTEFTSGKIQRCYPDGRKEVESTNGTVHKIFVDGSEETHLADGTIIIRDPDGTKTTQFANGKREIQTSKYKRIEYPDGAVKILYVDGKQETRHPNGRIRIKDKEGKVIIDTKYLGLTKD